MCRLFFYFLCCHFHCICRGSKVSNFQSQSFICCLMSPKQLQDVDRNIALVHCEGAKYVSSGESEVLGGTRFVSSN